MSKNVTVNGVSYTGVSKIQLETTGGGTALFQDMDEIVTSGGDSALVSTRATMRTVTITESAAFTGADFATQFGTTASIWAVYLNETPTAYQQVVYAYPSGFVRFGQVPTDRPALETKQLNNQFDCNVQSGTTYTVIEWE